MLVVNFWSRLLYSGANMTAVVAKLPPLVAFLLFVTSYAETKVYDFTVGWYTAFPIPTRMDEPNKNHSCHIEQPTPSGLITTTVEALLTLQSHLSINQLPASHREACATAADTPMYWNAAGNTNDYLDLTGANVGTPPLPEGFEVRGIVAILCSCLEAVMRIGTIGWYGLKPLSQEEESKEEGEVNGYAVGASISRS